MQGSKLCDNNIFNEIENEKKGTRQATERENSFELKMNFLLVYMRL